eukprot:PhF_6_TR33428/c1_g1_i1/m.48777
MSSPNITLTNYGGSSGTKLVFFPDGRCELDSGNSDDSEILKGTYVTPVPGTFQVAWVEFIWARRGGCGGCGSRCINDFQTLVLKDDGSMDLPKGIPGFHESVLRRST